MELPRALRQAVDAALEGVAARDLAAASDALSKRYRAELRDGKLHVADDLAAQAYLAARLPATYAAIRAAIGAVAALRPDFAPRSLIDFGAGPGTVLWAARDCWPDLDAATLIETSAAMRRFGAAFAPASGAERIDWRSDAPAAGQSDLVTVAYVLDELDAAQRRALVQQLWSLTADTLLIVEPGTPAGWQRILEARELLLRGGAHMIAPCPHVEACPLAPPDWCHFSRRGFGPQVRPAALPEARVIAPPRTGSGKVELKLCQRDGEARHILVTKREGSRFKRARRAGWGDSL